MRLEPWEPAYAVRRDWPDGTHDFIEISAAVLRAEASVKRDRNYWLRGPVRPRHWSVVVISLRDFDLHLQRRQCRAPDCAGASLTAPQRQAAPTDRRQTDGPPT